LSRDVKPENILILNEGNAMTQLGAVKLTDFGLARVLHHDNASSTAVDEELSMHQRNRAYSRVGSDYYAAPEILLSAGYDTPVDMYSLGVTLCVLLCGAPPAPASFFRSEEADLTDADASDADTSAPARRRAGPTAPIPSASQITAAARDLLAKMIHPDPDERITASEALQHDWIRTHVASQPPLSFESNSAFVKTRSPLHMGPTVADIPPSDSPHVEHVEPTPTPSNTSTSLTLADVCHKLAPLADERRHSGRQHGLRVRSHSGDSTLEPPRKRECSGDTRDHGRSSRRPTRRGASAGVNFPTYS
jgi:serine/threonine protein kinase